MWGKVSWAKHVFVFFPTCLPSFPATIPNFQATLASINFLEAAALERQCLASAQISEPEQDLKAYDVL